MNFRLTCSLFLGLLLSLTALADVTVLQLGVDPEYPLFTYPELDTSQEGFRLNAVYESRSLLDLPKKKEIIDSSKIPDIVPLYARFQDNDLAAYVETGMLEPLDSFLEEEGIVLSELMVPSLLDAVTYEGKIWALPLLLEPYVVVYNPQTLGRLSIDPNFSSWKALFEGAEKISNEAVPDTRIPGLQAISWPFTKVVPFFVWNARSLNQNYRPKTPFATLMIEGYSRGVFGGKEGIASSRDVLSLENAMELSLLHDTTVSTNKRFAAFPQYVADGDEEAQAPFAFLMSYGIRKNQPEKMQAAKKFITWLLKPETQLDIMKQNRRGALSGSFTIRHLPFYKHCWDSELFQEERTNYPDADTFLKIAETAFVTPADPALFQAPKEALLNRLEEATSQRLSEGRVESYITLMQPITYENQTAKTDTSKPAASFEEY